MTTLTMCLAFLSLDYSIIYYWVIQIYFKFYLLPTRDSIAITLSLHSTDFFDFQKCFPD